jgi:hypothetical protein
MTRPVSIANYIHQHSGTYISRGQLKVWSSRRSSRKVQIIPPSFNTLHYVAILVQYTYREQLEWGD